MGQLFFHFKRHVVRSVMAFAVLFPIESFSPVYAAAQGTLEDLIDRGDNSTNSEKLLEDIEELKENRIPINNAGTDELRQLPWLNSSDIHAIREWRNSMGPIISLAQLETVIGKSKALSIVPYISFEQRPKLPAAGSSKPFTGNLYSRVYWETTPREGILNGKYAGENYKLYNRLQFAFSKYKVSLVHEKDIGEPDFADFTSLSISAMDLGIITGAVLGNYELNFGQGLLVGQGRYFSKGSDPENSVRITSKRLSPYASSSEYGFFQGVAATIDLKPFALTAFYSANLIDPGNKAYSSIGTSGYHRNDLERSRKDRIQEKVYGGNLLYRFDGRLLKGKIGGSWLCYDYNAGSLETSDYLAGFETDFSVGRLGIFAEAAFAGNSGRDLSWIAGVEYEVLPKMNVLFAVRNYGADYYSPFAGAFAERGDDGSNEEGYYIGFDAKVSGNLSFAGYHDRFRFPVLKDIAYPYPSDGNDSRIFLTWKQSSAVSWNLQLQHKYKEEALKQCPFHDSESSLCKDKDKIYAPLPKITDRCRLDCDVELSRHVQLRTRGEVKKVVKDYLAGDERFYGWLIYQQAGFHTGKFGLKGRFTFFHTDDYDAAIYAYEDDLPLSFNLGMYNGRGESLIVLTTWEPVKNLKLGARFEKTWYRDRKVYSSGNDERNTSAPGSFHLGCSYSF